MKPKVVSLPVYLGAFILTPSQVDACPDQSVELSCTSTDIAVTVAEWTINVPGCLELSPIIRTTTPPDGLTVTAFSTTGSCPPGIMFHLSTVSVSPFVSNLTTSTALDGTVINCGDNQGRSHDVRITVITGKPLIAIVMCMMPLLSIILIDQCRSPYFT